MAKQPVKLGKKITKKNAGEVDAGLPVGARVWTVEEDGSAKDCYRKILEWDFWVRVDPKSNEPLTQLCNSLWGLANGAVPWEGSLRLEK